MNRKKVYGLFLVVILLMTSIWAVSCKSTPSQELMNELTAATNKAAAARQKAVNVQGPGYFPDDWKKAEADNDSGKRADKSSVDSVKAAIVSFNSAASGYEDIAARSAPLYAKELEDSKSELEDAMARAGKSKQDAFDNQGPVYFPDEWSAAEAVYNNGENTKKDALEDIKKAVSLYVSAADQYDDIAVKSAPLSAADKAKAQKDLQDAMARADKSRRDAQGVQANVYFPDDWQAAEDASAAGKDAPKTSITEMNEAAALYVVAADMYDELTEKSRSEFAKDDAQKALNAAMARAEKSRQSAVSASGQTNFPNEWKAAEDKNNGGKSAAKNTADEVKAATALFNGAADGYDDIARRSVALNKEKDDANKALQAAIARMDKSRAAAVTAKASDNAPNEWKNAETKGTAAKGAKRSTPAEMKAAVPLYNSASDAYDAAAKIQGSQVADAAKAKAEKERQGALDMKADVAVKADFDKAEAVYQAAVKDYAGKSYGPAADKYNQSATQFAAVAKTAEGKRASAEDVIGKARQKSVESAAFAVNPGLITEDNNETM